LDDGYVACEKYTQNQEVIYFVTLVVQRTGCKICDVSARRDIKLHNWLAVLRAYANR
jgi:hypothetical protein